MSVIPDEVIHLLSLPPSYFYDNHRGISLSNICKLHLLKTKSFRPKEKAEYNCYLALTNKFNTVGYFNYTCLADFAVMTIDEKTLDAISNGEVVDSLNNYDVSCFKEIVETWDEKTLTLQIIFK